jgi:high-affinity Fe2+/Pb2+ permease
MNKRIRISIAVLGLIVTAGVVGAFIARTETRSTGALNTFFRVLGIINIMFAGQFFLNMLDDYLKKKKWLKYRDGN